MCNHKDKISEVMKPTCHPSREGGKGSHKDTYASSAKTNESSYLSRVSN